MADIKNLKKLIAVRFVLALFVLGLIFFLPAGTLGFWEAWVYLGIMLIPLALVVMYFLKRDPEVLERRMRLKEKEQVQKIFVIANDLLFAAGVLLVGFDRRWNWTTVPVALVVAADVVVLVGYAVFVQVIKANRYLSRTVEVDSGQKVITTGPYAVVRHPMYAGVLLIYLFTPIALGSFWALIPFAILTAILPIRILNEEKVLIRDLEGYRAYMEKTKYRLIPGVW